MWYEKISESESQDFLERQKSERCQLIATLDGLILSLHQQYDDIKFQIEKHKKEDKAIPRYYLNLLLEVSKAISGLVEKKGFFMMKPTMDEGLKNKIKSMGGQNAKT